MLMRQPEYLPDAYGAIKKKVDSDYSANQAIWQTFWTEATLNISGVDKSSLMDSKFLPGKTEDNEAEEGLSFTVNVASEKNTVNVYAVL